MPVDETCVLHVSRGLARNCCNGQSCEPSAILGWDVTRTSRLMQLLFCLGRLLRTAALPGLKADPCMALFSPDRGLDTCVSLRETLAAGSGLMMSILCRMSTNQPHLNSFYLMLLGVIRRIGDPSIAGASVQHNR